MSRIAKGLVLTSVAAATVAGTAGVAAADSGAQAAAAHSPGVLSGNVVQAPCTSRSTCAATRSTSSGC
ncbi:hypothetical protein GCM10020295_53680 [Streptomyces cinereospinus]